MKNRTQFRGHVCRPQATPDFYVEPGPTPRVWQWTTWGGEPQWCELLTGRPFWATVEKPTFFSRFTIHEPYKHTRYITCTSWPQETELT